MEVINHLDENLWREFVNNHPQGQIFHTPEMFRVFAQTKNYQPTLWATVDQHQRPLALFLPVEITLMGILRRFTSRAVAYSSVLCVPGPTGQEALEKLLPVYRQAVGKKLLFTEFRNSASLDDLQPILNKNGFKHEDHLNFLVNLARPPEEIWNSIRSAAKRNIRQARKQGVTIKKVNEARRIPEVHAVLQAIYQRIQVPLVDVSFFQAAFDILYPQSMMEIFVASVQGVDVGVLTLLLHKDTALYWYTGSLREYTRYRAGDLLVWHIMEWASQQGFRILDFGGAGKPDEPYGVRDFKAKFGGELVNYGRNTCIHAPLTFTLSKIFYQIVRSVIYGR